MIRIVAAPGVPILTAISHEHVKGSPIILIRRPASVAAERLIGRAIVDARALIANGDPNPTPTIEAVAKHANRVDILR